MIPRPPRRPHMAPRGRPARVPLRPPQRLIRANARMEEGRYGDAAELFLQLSQGARRRGMPIRAAHLAIRASDALLADQRPQQAVDRLVEALSVLLRHGQVQRAAHVASSAAARLREGGLETEASALERRTDRLRQELGVADAEWQAPPTLLSGPARGTLPDRCDGCGASLVPGDVVWHEARKAECPYCGSILSAT